VSALTAIGAVSKKTMPGIAVALKPLNGFAVERLASGLVKAAIASNRGEVPHKISDRLASLAKTAFYEEPLTPAAVAMLALAGPPASDRQRLMAAAESLSRREPLITAWMIADSKARDDIPAILAHYDTMLRTSSTAGALILPAMGMTLTNSDFIEPMASLLKTDPPWAPQFWGTVVVLPEAIGNASELRKRLYRAQDDKVVYRDADLIGELVFHHQFEQAESLYRVLAGESSEVPLLTNSSFKNEPVYPPLDWQLFSSGSYGANIKDGNLRLSAMRNSGGLFARQLINIPATTLQIDVQMSRAVPDQADLAIVLQCGENNNNMSREVRIKLTDSSISRTIDNRNSGCRYYWLNVTGRASDEGFDMSIESISIKI
tara:strand:- start:12196 stop:13320 length:1125 start_codon:yes stop_codon:yes gene_type:complete